MVEGIINTTILIAISHHLSTTNSNPYYYIVALITYSKGDIFRRLLNGHAIYLAINYHISRCFANGKE